MSGVIVKIYQIYYYKSVLVSIVNILISAKGRSIREIYFFIQYHMIINTLVGVYERYTFLLRIIS